MKLLVTGATGFVGLALTKAACRANHDVSALIRAQNELLPVEAKQIVVGDFARLARTQASDELMSAMQGVDVVIHTAGRAHVMKEDQADPGATYQLMNKVLTEKLALAAAEAGVKRFVFISSIKVNGETTHGKSFDESDIPAPKDDYGRSKLAAEHALREIVKRTDMEFVILRPPLIYGPGVKGNFASLIELVQKRVPLPFGTINNRRSLIALDNIVSAILLASVHPSAANQIFLLADDEVVSTSQLIKQISHAQGNKTKLISVPVSWMKFFAALMGKSSACERLFGSLQIDASKIRHIIGWKPVTSMSRQLAKMFSQVRETD